MTRRRTQRGTNPGQAPSEVPARSRSTLQPAPARPDARVLPIEIFTAEVVSEQFFSGPIPHPEILGAFEQAHPGAAAKIFDMAVDEQGHRHLMEHRLLGLSYLGLVFGFVLALFLFGGAFFLLYHDKTLGGLTPIIGGLTALVAIFVLQRRKPPPQDTTAEE